MRLASFEVTIEAPAEVVWSHLTTAEGLVRWVGPAATADPAPGGSYAGPAPTAAASSARSWKWSPIDGWSSLLLGGRPERMGVLPEHPAQHLVCPMSCPRTTDSAPLADPGPVRVCRSRVAQRAGRLAELDRMAIRVMQSSGASCHFPSE